MRRWSSSSLSMTHGPWAKIICRHLGHSHYKLIFELQPHHSVFTELGYHEQINILRNMELEKEKNENRRKSRRKSSYKNRYKKSFNSKMLEVVFNCFLSDSIVSAVWFKNIKLNLFSATNRRRYLHDIYDMNHVRWYKNLFLSHFKYIFDKWYSSWSTS